MQALQALGVPAYKVGHAGLAGPGDTCIQGMSCRPYRSWGTCKQGRTCWLYRSLGWLHTRQDMLAFRSAAGFMCLSGIEGVWRREAELPAATLRRRQVRESVQHGIQSDIQCLKGSWSERSGGHPCRAIAKNHASTKAGMGGMSTACLGDCLGQAGSKVASLERPSRLAVRQPVDWSGRSQSAGSLLSRGIGSGGL